MTFLPDGEEIIDIMNQTKFKSWNSEFLVMDSNDFILASTNESIKVPLDHAAFVAGRSSIGRIGIQVQNAGFVDSGFEGEVTLELHNQSNKKILLHKGMRICQIVFMKMTSSCIKPYNGKYQFQKGATFSKIHEDVINPM
jgi:dCTP deaminase